MATRTWIGGTTAVAQVDTLTVGGTVESDDVFSITLTGEGGATQTLNVTAGSTSTTTVASTIATAFNASVLSLFTRITAAANSSTVTLTADTAGVPFYCSVTTTENGGGAADAQTFTRAATTANAGPNDWNTAANWAEGAVPVAGDDVFITGANAISYGLDQDSVTLNSFVVEPGCTANIGSASYKLDLLLGSNDLVKLSGTGTIYLDLSATDTDVIVENTASVTTGSGLAGLYLSGSAIVDIYLRKGTLKLVNATVTGDIFQSYTTTQATDTTLMVPQGNTLTGVDLKKTGGTASIDVALATVTNDAGTTTLNGSGAVTTVVCNGGFVYANTSGTITTASARGDGVIDLTRSREARTVSNADAEGEGSVVYDPNVVTLTNAPTGEHYLRIQAE